MLVLASLWLASLDYSTLEWRPGACVQTTREAKKRVVGALTPTTLIKQPAPNVGKQA